MTMTLITAIAAGLLSALPLLIASSEPGGLFLLMLAPLPLFAIGLAQGVIGSAIAGGTLLLAATALVGFLAAGSLLLFMVGPVVLLVRQSLLNRVPAMAGGPSGNDAAGPGAGIEWYPPGLLVTWLVWIGVAWLVVSLAMLIGEPDGMEATVTRSLEQSLTMMLPDFDPARIAEAAAGTASIAVGFGIVSWLVVLTVNGVLAQGALSSMGRNLRPSPDPAEIWLPRWIAPALAVTLGIAFLVSGDLGFVARNLAPILLLPFFFDGLAVVHAHARRTRFVGLILVLFYTLLLLFTWAAAFVVFLGLFDQWANIRRRLAAADSGQEEE